MSRPGLKRRPENQDESQTCAKRAWPDSSPSCHAQRHEVLKLSLQKLCRASTLTRRVLITNTLRLIQDPPKAWTEEDVLPTPDGLKVDDGLDRLLPGRLEPPSELSLDDFLFSEIEDLLWELDPCGPCVASGATDDLVRSLTGQTFRTDAQELEHLVEVLISS